MDERIHLPVFFDRHVLGNVKILDFTGNLGVERGGIEMGNAPDAGASIDDAVPGAVNIVADRADDTQPGNDDTSFHGRLLVIGGTWRAFGHIRPTAGWRDTTADRKSKRPNPST